VTAEEKTAAQTEDAGATGAGGRASAAAAPTAAAKKAAREALEAEKAAATPLVRSPLRGEVSRRGLFSALGLGWAALTAASLGTLGALTRFLFPNVLYEPPQEFKAGFPAEFAVDQVDERFKASYGVWIVREATGFYALSTVCTHLGCTPNWLSAEGKFKCPCHGSGFVMSGINIEGPAPRPLERYRIGLAEDGQIQIDKNTKYQEEKGQWAMDGAYLFYTA
jgi:cytochrome b6-f complex iron-sulfur subunit